jgi:hypothetical protein
MLFSDWRLIGSTQYKKRTRRLPGVRGSSVERSSSHRFPRGRRQRHPRAKSLLGSRGMKGGRLLSPAALRPRPRGCVKVQITARGLRPLEA